MKDQIREIIEESLKKGGKVPSRREVRERLGSGSLTTINSIMRELEAERSVPDPLPGPIATLIDDLRKELVTSWPAAETLRDQLTNSDNELAAALAAVDEAEAAESHAREQAETAIKERDQVRRDMDALRRECDSAKASLHDVEAKSVTRLDEERARCDVKAAELAEAQRQLAESFEHVKTATAQLSEARALAARLEGRLESSDGAHTEHLRAETAMRAEIDALKSALREAEQRATAERASAQQRVDAAREKLDASVGEIAALQRALADERVARTQAETQLGEAGRTIASLTPEKSKQAKKGQA